MNTACGSVSHGFGQLTWKRQVVQRAVFRSPQLVVRLLVMPRCVHREPPHFHSPRPFTCLSSVPARRLALGYYVSQLAAALTAALPGAFTFTEPAAAAGKCPGGADPRAEALTPLPAPKLHVSAVAARRQDPAARDLLERAWALCLKHGVATDAAAAWDATVAPALQVIQAVCLGRNPNPKP